MKKILAVIMVLCMSVVSAPAPAISAKAPSDSELYSLSAALIDGDSGRVLYEKNGYDKRAMASTTKIMTLIIALEYGNIDDIVTVSSYAAKMPDVQLGICEGEQYYMKDLIYSMMLESHNDSSVAIAEHIGGDVTRFADMMNDKAAELGLSSTYFITPNGLDAEDKTGKHSTTATELALIMKYCVMDSPERELFMEICGTREYSFSDYSGARFFSVANKNRFLDMMDGVLAGKTGFTADAGYCYVAAVRRDDRTYIIALLGCGWPGNKGYKWQDSIRLVSYGIDCYTKRDISYKKPDKEEVKIYNGIEADHINICTEDISKILLSDEDEVSFKVCLPEVIEAPVYKNDIVGSVDIYINDELYKTVNIYSENTVTKVTIPYCAMLVVKEFLRLK